MAKSETTTKDTRGKAVKSGMTLRGIAKRFDVVSLGLFMFSLVLLVVSAGYVYSQYSTPPTSVSVVNPLEGIAQQKPKLPELTLNHVHTRFGSTVVVNPEDIGKQNPFTGE